MTRRGPHLATVCVLGMAGCAQVAPRPDYVEVVRDLHATAHRPPGSVDLDDPIAVALDPAPAPAELARPQPVEVYIRRALAENRSVQSARYNVEALNYRIPQVTALDDPVLRGMVWPFPSNGPQGTTGYAPYSQMVTQQLPWFGTLALRGQVARQEVRIALFELASRQLEVVARVKRSYQDLSYNQRAEAIFRANRDLAEDIVAIAERRYAAGTTSFQDVLRARVAVTELDRELVAVRRGLARARADLAGQLHVSPEADLRAVPLPSAAEVPAQVERLYRLAAAVRPDLQGRLAAIARDEGQVELARKRYYPDLQLGVAYNLVTARNAEDPLADGRDDVGFVVGFNLPVYRRKLAAAVCEAQARTLADARRYDYDRDQAYAEIKDLHAEAEALRDTLDLLQGSILPNTQQALEVATRDYTTGVLDYLTLNTARQEVLRVEVQIARLEADLGKALASLERAVGVQLNGHPPATPAAEPAPEPDPVPERDDLPEALTRLDLDPEAPGPGSGTRRGRRRS